eukprot:jgi/Picsp_1/6292/NSC_03642-R1_gtp-binding protein 2
MALFSSYSGVAVTRGGIQVAAKPIKRVRSTTKAYKYLITASSSAEAGSGDGLLRPAAVPELEDGRKEVEEAMDRVKQALNQAENVVSRIESLPSARLPTRMDKIAGWSKAVLKVLLLLGYCTLIHAFNVPSQVIGGFFLAVAVAVRGYKNLSLSPSGALAAAFVGWATLASSFRAGLVLLGFFFASSEITKFGDENKDVEENFKKGGQRNWIQVLSNGLVPSVLALLASAQTGGLEWATLPVSSHQLYSMLSMAFLGYFSCCCGDTWSSEIGQLSEQEPRLITSLRPVRKGTNGGVTLLGLGASVAGGLYIGMLFYVSGIISPSGVRGGFVQQWPLIAIGACAGLVGSLIDSFLGATIQFTGFNRKTGKITDLRPLGNRRPPIEWASTYVPQKDSKVRSGNRVTASRRRLQSKKAQNRQKAIELAKERFKDGPELPNHLLRYGVRVRSNENGPSILLPENEEGSTEYKLRLTNNNPLRFEQLVTQLQYRLSEGNGESTYLLGVEDNGHPFGLDDRELQTSLDTLKAMAKAAGAHASVLRLPLGIKGRRCAVVRVHTQARHRQASSYDGGRVVVLGEVDSGKSTLVSVLSHGSDGKPCLDSGRGSARMRVMRHKHEIQSGRSSSSAHHLVKYNEQGDVLNYANVGDLHDMAENRAFSYVNLVDVGGHSSVSKTAIRAMTCNKPDCCVICISATTGLRETSLDQLAVALLLSVPVCLVVTKIDCISNEKLWQVQSSLDRLMTRICRLCNEHAKRQWGVVKTPEDALSKHMQLVSSSESISVPIVHLSSTSGEGIRILHTLLKNVADRAELSREESTPSFIHGVAFQVDSVFRVSGVGIVLSGIVLSHKIEVGEIMQLGPGKDGHFQKIQIVGIHKSHKEVCEAIRGHYVTIAIASYTETIENKQDNSRMILEQKDTTATQHSEISEATGHDLPDSEDELQALGRSWDFSDLLLSSIDSIHSDSGNGTGVKNKVDRSNTKKPLDPIRKKGAVLLTINSMPTICASFKAIIVINQNLWPYRCGHMSSNIAAHIDSCTSSVCTFHCGSVQQLGKFSSLEPIDPAHAQELYPRYFTESVNSSFCSAAAVFYSRSEERTIVNKHMHQRLFVANVHFVHREEFILVGSRVVLRNNESGRLCGGGIVVSAPSSNTTTL